MSTPRPLSPADRSTEELRGWLTTLIAEYLNCEPAELDPRRPLAELGMDSVYAVSVGADIEDRLGIPLEPTLAWDHPTIDAIAEYLHGVLEER